jgi:hypothetical protein
MLQTESIYQTTCTKHSRLGFCLPIVACEVTCASPISKNISIHSASALNACRIDFKRAGIVVPPLRRYPNESDRSDLLYLANFASF